MTQRGTAESEKRGTEEVLLSEKILENERKER